MRALESSILDIINEELPRLSADQSVVKMEAIITQNLVELCKFWVLATIWMTV